MAVIMEIKRGDFTAVFHDDAIQSVEESYRHLENVERIILNALKAQQRRKMMEANKDESSENH